MALTPTIDPRRIPIIGEDIYQVGQVIRIVDQTCTPDARLFVQGMFSYSPALIWALLKPDPLDLTYDRLKGQSKRKRYRKFSIRDAQFGPRLSGPQYVNYGFKIAGIAQRVGWYMIVADATTDWLVNWTSMAYTFGGCTHESSTYARAYGAQPIPRVSIGPDEVQVVYGNFESGGAGYGSNSAVGVSNIGPYTVSFTLEPEVLEWGGVKGSVTNVRLEVSISNGPWEEVETTKMGEPDEGETWSAVVENFYTAPKKVEARAYVSWTGGALYVRGGSMQIAAGPPQAWFPDP